MDQKQQSFISDDKKSLSSSLIEKKDPATKFKPIQKKLHSQTKDDNKQKSGNKTSYQPRKVQMYSETKKQREKELPKEEPEQVTKKQEESNLPKITPIVKSRDRNASFLSQRDESVDSKDVKKVEKTEVALKTVQKLNQPVVERNSKENISKLRQTLIKNHGYAEELVKVGERFISKVETSLVYNETSIDGHLIFTNYSVNFIPLKQFDYEDTFQRKQYVHFPLTCVSHVVNNQNKRHQKADFEFFLKDQRYLQFKFGMLQIDQAETFYQALMKQVYSDSLFKTFGYNYFENNKALEQKYQGWNRYDIEGELKRQRLLVAPCKWQQKDTPDQQYIFRYMDNSSGNICQTYPPLLVVPALLSDDEVIKSSKFRTKERLPSLVFAMPCNTQESGCVTLWRSSQVKAGIQNHRNEKDELMLKCIGDPLNGPSMQVLNLQVYDARPYIAAVGNQVSGKGFENTKFYNNCDIEWLDIKNIHAVRESYQKQHSAIFSDKYQKTTEDSGWLDFSAIILQGAVKVVESLQSGMNVLVHCSDGWDRTSQLTALAQLLIDPYFRTMRGFQVLIEKEWCSFGHQFYRRNGNGASNYTDEQRSPIFIQFLDTVFQLTQQFPMSFEFNTKFLSEIAYHTYSCLYGTFMCNNWQDKLYYDVFNKTISLWSYIDSVNRTYYINPFYKPADQSNLTILFPDYHGRSMILWKELFCMWVPSMKDSYQYLSQTEFNMDNLNQAHFQIKVHNEQLVKEQNETRFLKMQLEKYKQKYGELDSGSLQNSKNEDFDSPKNIQQSPNQTKQEEIQQQSDKKDLENPEGDQNRFETIQKNVQEENNKESTIVDESVLSQEQQ